MSTIKTTNLQHPSAASPNLVLAADGSVSGGVGLGGLVLVSPTSIANSGGSASASGGAVSFTGVSSVSLNGVFTSAYDNYEIVINLTTADVATFRLRLSGTDNTTSNYAWQQGFFDGTTVVGERVIGANLWRVGNGNTTSTNTPVRITIINPSIAEPSQFFGLSIRNLTTPLLIPISGVHNVSAAFDGFTLTGVSSMTGTVRVYGYRNS